MNDLNNIRKRFKNFYFTKVAWLVIGFLFLITSIYICLKGPELGNDSYGYMNMYVIRPAGYPLFLFLLRQIFREGYLQVAVIFQTLLNAAVLIVFLRYLSKRFSVHVKYILLLVPLALFFFVYAVSPEVILTESLAFPLFILIAILLIESIVKRDIRILIFSIIINTVLVTVRGQFLFMYPVFVLVGGYIFFRSKEMKGLKMPTIFVAAIVLSLAGSSLINRTYHYVFHGSFASPHINGGIIVNTFYLSERDDYQLLDNEMHKELYIDIYDSLYSRGYNMQAFYDKINPSIKESARRRSDVIYHYSENYNNIYDIIKLKFTETDHHDIQSVLNRDNQLKAITFEILPNYIFSYLYINFSDIFIHGLGKNRLDLLVLILFLFISFLGLIRQNVYGEVLFFFTSAHILNLILIAISNRVLGRYIFYITFILYCILFIIFINEVLLRRNKNEIDDTTAI